MIYGYSRSVDMLLASNLWFVEEVLEYSFIVFICLFYLFETVLVWLCGCKALCNVTPFTHVIAQVCGVPTDVCCFPEASGVLDVFQRRELGPIDLSSTGHDALESLPV